MIAARGKDWARAITFLVLAGGLLGAGCLRACQWLDQRIDVRLKWEEVSSP